MKSEIVHFRVSAEFKSDLEHAADNLDMPMSKLLRDSFYSYIDARIVTARNRFLARAVKYLPQDAGTEAAAGHIDALMAGMKQRGIETWGDPDLMPEDVFEGFVKMKLAVREHELVEA